MPIKKYIKIMLNNIKTTETQQLKLEQVTEYARKSFQQFHL